MKSLKNAIQNEDVVLIVGTGITAAMTDNDAHATWPGLVRHGAKHLDNSGTDRTQNYVDIIDKMLELNSTEATVAAATLIGIELKARGDAFYQNWLEETVGSLRIVKPDIATALEELRRPILTTNYDTLLEDALSRVSSTWQDYSDIQQALQGKSKNVIHLHGVWNDPSSVIFSDGDYSKLEGSESAQTLLRAIGAIKTIVYVGIGSGLSDPNFGQLLKWLRRVFPNRSMNHYRLCLDHELPALLEEHAEDRIKVVPYGASYGNLVSFLKSIAPISSDLVLSDVGVAVDRPSELQSEFEREIIEQVRMAAEELPSSIRIDQVVSPPVLLPVPYGEYTALKQKNKAKTVRRLNLESEINSGESLLVVSEPGYGLSTSLKWLAINICTELVSAIPIYLSFSDLRKPRQPLINELLSQFRKYGYKVQTERDFPPHVLIIDDYDPNTRKLSDRILNDLRDNSQALVTLIGCKHGVEHTLKSQLDAIGLSVKVRYLGKLEPEDVLNFARNAAPARADEIASQTLKVLESERLPRTPFSVTLIINVLLNGDAVSATSETAVLNQFVSVILGQGALHEDSRWQISLQDRELLLSFLAERMVEEDSAGLGEVDVIQLIDETMESLGWQVDSASHILRNLVRRNILQLRGRHVMFSRSSYLFLFAAKRAINDEKFLSRLIERPLYNAPILRANAALLRNNRLLLEEVAPLVHLGEIKTGSISPHEHIEPRPPIDFDQVEQRESGQGHNNIAAKEPDDQNGIVSGLYSPDDTDRPPFPSTDPDNEPFNLRLVKVLDLVSPILRDSDAIADNKLKESVLEGALRSWGVLARVLSNDSSFQEFVHELLSSIDFPDDVLASERADLLATISRVFPTAISAGGIAQTLSSFKLLGPFRTLLKSDRLVDDDAQLGAMLFCFTLKYDGWISDLGGMLRERNDNRWVVSQFLMPLLLVYYHSSHTLTDNEMLELARLCADIDIASRVFSSEREISDYRGRFMQHLRHQRLVEQGPGALSSDLERAGE